MRFLARLNLTLQGQTLVSGKVYDLNVNDPETLECAAAHFLIPEEPDGTFAGVDFDPHAAVRCCGA